MKKKFNIYDKFNLSEINKEVLAQWNAANLFEQSMKEREGCPSFVFYEGQSLCYRDDQPSYPQLGVYVFVRYKRGPSC